jgi:hypothetical protein
MLCGCLLLVFSMHYFEGPAAGLGLMMGLLYCAVGATSLLGTLRRDSQLLCANVVGGFLLLVMSIGFVSQVRGFVDQSRHHHHNNNKQ